ncbi:MAG: DUF1428 domain-containing protein [Myxococcales bacterium]|nr:MAG: DUF1428 domain-containing protein [Myxococcales bacterium]
MYIDGYLIPVPKANKEKYLEAAKKAAHMFKEYGASRIVEGWGDDVPKGKVTDFYGAVKSKEDEVVMFSWIEWPSKAVRNEGMKKMMEDAKMKDMDMPFDGQRMIYGGFDPILDQDLTG